MSTAWRAIARHGVAAARRRASSRERVMELLSDHDIAQEIRARVWSRKLRQPQAKGSAIDARPFSEVDGLLRTPMERPADVQGDLVASLHEGVDGLTNSVRCRTRRGGGRALTLRDGEIATRDRTL